MISHNTALRDYLDTAQRARAMELLPSMKSQPITPEHRRRRDDAWEKRIARELAGEDLINDKAA